MVSISPPIVIKSLPIWIIISFSWRWYRANLMADKLFKFWPQEAVDFTQRVC